MFCKRQRWRLWNLFVSSAFLQQWQHFSAEVVRLLLQNISTPTWDWRIGSRCFCFVFCCKTISLFYSLVMYSHIQCLYPWYTRWKRYNLVCRVTHGPLYFRFVILVKGLKTTFRQVALTQFLVRKLNRHNFYLMLMSFCVYQHFPGFQLVIFCVTLNYFPCYFVQGIGLSGFCGSCELKDHSVATAAVEHPELYATRTRDPYFVLP